MLKKVEIKKSRRIYACLNCCNLDFYCLKNQHTLWLRYAGSRITLADSTNSDGCVTKDNDSVVTTNAIHVSDGAEVIINSGNYKGISAASVQSSSALTISGRKFISKKNRIFSYFGVKLKYLNLKICPELLHVCK